jgi:predicted CXXCH cytochrome family protein
MGAGGTGGPPAAWGFAASLPFAALLAFATPARPQGATAAPGAAAGKCGVCHPAERVQFETSSHAREQVHCVACHGGDDKSLEQAVAHGGGFRGRPARAAIPALCASCHSSEQRMRAYNLPVDQYALYQTSGHGVRLAHGDTRVAVCSDCHGAHDILSPTDPGSRVFPANIPRTCGRCHGDSTVVSHKDQVFAEYSRSVHAQALIDRGNLRSPTCVSCHGVHGAAPPAIGDVDKVCGQCHTAERRYFNAGEHRSGDRAGPECSTCHGAHDISAARPERLPESCVDCHAAGSREATIGQRVWSEYRGAAEAVEKAAAVASRAEAVPINTDDYRARLEEAKTYLREALPAAHSVREDLVTGFTSRALSVAREVDSELRHKLGHLETRRYILILFWFYLLLTILVLIRFQRRGAGSA